MVKEFKEKLWNSENYIKILAENRDKFDILYENDEE
jgi:hypothetical protein